MSRGVPAAVIRAIQVVMAPTVRRVRLMVSRAVVEAVNDALKCQGLQVSLLAGEVKDGVEHFQEYGFTSHAPAGSEGVGLFVSGDRGHGIVVAVGDRRVRLKNLAQGEVAVYTDEGDKIHLKRGRIIEINGGTRVDIVAGTEVRAGSSSATDFVALAQLVLDRLNALKTAFSNWTVVPNDGGAALKTLLTNLISAGWPQSVAATKVKAL